MKTWDELTDDDRFIVVRLETPPESTPEARKKHRFCTRCWYEDTGRNRTVA